MEESVCFDVYFLFLFCFEFHTKIGIDFRREVKLNTFPFLELVAETFFWFPYTAEFSH
jgi:hypothetical protein